MKPLTILFALLFCFSAAAQSPVRVYLIPGQGSDERVYSKLKLDPRFDTVYVHYTLPEKRETMNSYAHKLAAQIDTTQPFLLVGVSLGGMLATEMSAFLHPQKTVIISSAQNRSELPWRYKFMKALPLYRLFPAGFIKACSFIAQPLVEPDRKKEKAIFKAMLHAKNKRFLKRSIGCIVRWKGPSAPLNCKVTHIHGAKDHTLPLRRVKADYVVKGGSHMMVLTKPEEISELLNKILSE